MRKNIVDFVSKKPIEVNQVLRLIQEGMILKGRFEAV
jgi:hypothetical protein